MPYFLVTLKREIEWENMYEAPNADVAVDLAKLEAREGTILDEQVIVGEVEPALVVD